MRKFAAAILFALTFGAGLQVETAEAQDGVATFRIVNKASYTIFLKMYSNRNRVWPGATSHWTLDDNQVRTFRLACGIGEKVCYGAGYQMDGSGNYWGVGFLNTESCQSCCIVCGSQAANVTQGYSLDE